MSRPPRRQRARWICSPSPSPLLLFLPLFLLLFFPLLPLRLQLTPFLSLKVEIVSPPSLTPVCPRQVAEEASVANADAAKAAAKVAQDERTLRMDEQAAGPPAAIAQQKQAALNSANQRLAAAMAYAASETRNMDRALAAETAAKASEEARLVSVATYLGSQRVLGGWFWAWRARRVGIHMIFSISHASCRDVSFLLAS